MARPKDWKQNPKIMEAQDISDVIDYIKSPEFTEQDYIDIHSGLYEHVDPSFGYGYSTRNALLDTKYNNIVTNKKTLDSQMELKQKMMAHDPEYKPGEDDERIEHLARHFSLGSKTIHDLLHDEKYWLKKNHWDDEAQPQPVEAALDNPNTQKDHLYKYVAKHPERGFDVLGHDLADDHLEDIIFKDPEKIKDMDARNIKNYLYEKSNIVDEGTRREYNLSDKRMKDLLNHGHEHIETDHIKSMLEQTDENFRKDFIDRKLGITDGKPNFTEETDFSENQNPEDLKWNNWIKGDEHDKRLSEMLSSSNMLTDDQVEHLKRHGDFQSKYNLYHNKDIDSRHGIEMFNKWSSDQSEHGYDAEELIEGLKNDHKKRDTYTIDDLPEGVYDEEEVEDRARERADEYASERYSVSEWVDDNEDEVLEKIDIDDDILDNLSEKLHENYDWDGDNPDHDQELHDMHDSLYDAIADNDGKGGRGFMHGDDVLKLAQQKDPKIESLDDIGIGDLVDENDEIEDSDLEEHMKENNPKEIDYTDHEDGIHAHPEYETRESEVINDVKREYLRDNMWEIIDNHYLYDDHRESERYQEVYDEEVQDAIEEEKKELVRQHHDELYETSHQDDRFVPEHLRDQIPGLAEMKKERKKLSGEGRHRPWLNETITERDYEHSYGEGLHHHEMVKDYADANGGSIDVGRMHKMFPALKDTWKKIFDGKGKISSDEIQGKIDALPKTNYDMSYGKWDSNKMQNTNSQDQVIFRLDHSDESLAPLKEDEGLYNTFKKVQQVSKRSGHPTRDNTIAWARVDTTDPKHWFIDEVQSDFGKTVTKYLKDNGDEEKAKHVQTISDLHKDWRENLINHIKKQAKKHGADKISTHSPDSKASHTGSGKAHSVYKDSYQKVPRKMGFMPAKHDELAITEKARSGIFNKNNEEAFDTLAWQHKDAMEYHNEASDLFRYHLANSDSEPVKKQAKEFYDHHVGMAGKHRERAMGYSKDEDWKHGLRGHSVNTEPDKDHLKSSWDRMKNNDKPSTHEYDKHLNKQPLSSEPSYHDGHVLDLNPKIKKHQLDLVDDLVKFEIIFSQSNSPEIRKRAGYNIDLIKNMLGHEEEVGPVSGKHMQRLEMIQKGMGDKIKAGIAGVAMAATMTPKAQAQDTTHKEPVQVEQTIEHDQHQESVFSHENALKAIAQVESSGGKNIKHRTIASGMHKGQHSRSKYGLMPIVIKETIKAHKDLSEKYGYLTKLNGESFHEKYHSHPGLDDLLASKHLKRLQSHFGDDIEKISKAWEGGITGTKRAIKRGDDIKNHWHVKKVKKAYDDIQNNK